MVFVIGFNLKYSLNSIPYHSILASILATSGRNLATSGHILATSGCILATLAHILATSGRILATLTHILATSGRILATSAHILTTTQFPYLLLYICITIKKH